jgi:hypothetical protein
MPYPAAVDLTVWRNADYAETWIVAESFDVSGVAVGAQDLTGWTASLQVRQYGLAGGDPELEIGTVVTAVEGVRIIEPAAGQMEVRIDTATLEALPSLGAKAGYPVTFKYDLLLTDPDGVVSVYAAGDFIVQPGVTR